MTLKSTIQSLTLVVLAMLISGIIHAQMTYGHPGYDAGLLWLANSHFAETLLALAGVGMATLLVVAEIDTVTNCIFVLILTLALAAGGIIR
jgi:hypothetical protein